LIDVAVGVACVEAIVALLGVEVVALCMVAGAEEVFTQPLEREL